MKVPTKTTNIGGQGGARQGSGRRKAAVVDKITDESKREKILDIPDVEGSEMPKPNEILSAKQKNGEAFRAKSIYENTWEWLQKIGCTVIVSPQLIERYAMCSARWIQCEEAVSSFGFLARHPTTGNAIQSPYVAMGQNYMNQTNRLWNEIFQIVKENCTGEYSGANPQDDVMERLLTARRGK
jgi:hypothetical protein